MPVSCKVISEIASLLTDDPDLLCEWGEQSQLLSAFARFWFDPDTFWTNRGSITFIYGPNDSMYYGDNASTTHNDVIVMNRLNPYNMLRALNGDEVGDDFDIDYNSEANRSLLEDCALFGRIGITSFSELAEVYNSSSSFRRKDAKLPLSDYPDDKFKIVSFWSINHSLINKLMKPCLERLIADKLLSINDLVSYPGKTTSISDMVSSGASKVSDEDAELAMMWGKLHLMPPDQKRAAMERLGLVQSQPVVNKKPIQREMEKTGAVQRGHKWWAPTSEGFYRKLDEVFW